MPTPEGDAALLRRSNGNAPNGEVTIEDFDRGVIETFGAEPLPIPGPRASTRYAYYWRLSTVKPPPGMPGVPVIFAPSEDSFERFKIPYVKITPGGLTPAMQRWHPGMIEYRAPARTARPVVVGSAQGFDRYVEKRQAHPFDIAYTFLLATKRRAMVAPARGPAQLAVPAVEGGSANQLLTELLRVYPAYCGVNVRDSALDYRTYQAFMEGITPADEVNEVGDRVVGYTFSLRVEGELDLDPTTEHPAVTRTLTVRPATL